PGDALAAQHRRGGVGRAAQFGDHLVLADHVGEHAAALHPAVGHAVAGPSAARRPAIGPPATRNCAGGRAAVKHLAAAHSRMTGMLPVLSSATAGTGSGSMPRIRSRISLLSWSCGRVASSTRYRPGSSLAWARKPSLTRWWKSAGSASSRSADGAR